MTNNSVDQCIIVELPKIKDPRGNLTIIESSKNIPFDIKRVFYIYDVPTGESRGAHAHKTLQQFIVCLSGSFDVKVDDGNQKKTIHLNRPWQGVYIPQMIWSAETNFDAGSVCLLVVSDFYDESDYYRNYDEFLKALRKNV